MTIKEVEGQMCSAAQEIINECEKKLEELPADSGLERKAQKIRKGVASFCKKLAMLGHAVENPAGWRRDRLLALMDKWPDYSDDKKRHIQNCPDSEITYLHALLWAENDFMKRYKADIEKARQFNEDENIFKNETQFKTMARITEKWREFGKTEGFSDEY
ncbi:MAG: hypothetical protein FWF08_09325 [Oscillospiraceae bacterium]|nr:hypothetical protein [Oscillospiraceae bacterium]